MTRATKAQWERLAWEVADPDEKAAGDVSVRLVSPALEGGGRVVIRFGVRRVTLPGEEIAEGEGLPIAELDVLAPTAVTVEGPNGDHLGPATIAALRDVPLVALVDSARIVARDVLRRPGRARPGGGADALDVAIAEFATVRHLGPTAPEFLTAFVGVLDLAELTHPEKPMVFLATTLGVGRSTVGRWAVAAREARGKND